MPEKIGHWIAEKTMRNTNGVNMVQELNLSPCDHLYDDATAFWSMRVSEIILKEAWNNMICLDDPNAQIKGNMQDQDYEFITVRFKHCWETSENSADATECATEKEAELFWTDEYKNFQILTSSYYVDLQNRESP